VKQYWKRTKRFWKGTILAVLVIVTVVVLFKVAQKVCWDNNLTLIAPPSLDSWDPTERVEAARQAMKRYGGKQ
jgi:hypothetical protein